MNKEEEKEQGEEFYHKDLFGEVIDFDLALEEEEGDIGKKAAIDFNIFTLTDALASRDKKNAWILYRKAIAAGMVPEEIFWKLVWQVKSLMLASRTKTAEEAGMKAYPYSKAKGYLQKWPEGELEQLSEKLVIGYHECRLGKEEMETLIEKVLLGL